MGLQAEQSEVMILHVVQAYWDPPDWTPWGGRGEDLSTSGRVHVQPEGVWGLCRTARTQDQSGWAGSLSHTLSHTPCQSPNTHNLKCLSLGPLPMEDLGSCPGLLGTENRAACPPQSWAQTTQRATGMGTTHEQGC